MTKILTARGSKRSSVTALIALAMVCLALMSPLTARPSAAQTAAAPSTEFDEYGGWTGITVQGGATGFFRTAQIGNRWLLVTPKGHPFWMLSVYNVSPGGGGRPYSERINQKYPTKKDFAVQAVRRLRTWGFNTIGEYSSTYVYPLGTHGAKTGNPEKLPFIRIVRPSGYSLRANVGVKDIVAGADPKIYTGWRGSLADVFDPKFEEFARSHASGTGFSEPLERSPWLVGTTVDDADNLRGFKRGDAVHPIWIVAVTASAQTSNESRKASYADTKVYSKLAWRDFLGKKYETVTRLNTAWGSRYTTFNSDGGWPTGTGLLDESGRSHWLHTKDFGPLHGISPVIIADLNEFLSVFAERYFSVVSSAVRAATPHHLVFGPAAIKYDARPEILRVAAKYIDIFHAYAVPEPVESVVRFYDLVKKPIVLWLGLTAQADSALASLSRGSGVDYPDQEARGKAYARFLDQLVKMQGADQARFMVGIDWWAWVDSRGERLNWGLVSFTGDNPYDGKQAVVTPGVDAWGYPTGGEVQNYGDFLSHVSQANLRVWQTFRSQIELARKAHSR